MSAPRPYPTDRRPWWSFLLKRPVQYALDLVVLAAMFLLAYQLRFDFDVPPTWSERAWFQAPFVVVVQLCALALCGVYAFIWRYVGMAETQAFVRAAILSGAPLLLLRFFLPEDVQHGRVPLSVIVVDTLLAFGGVLALRVVRRAVYERYEKQATPKAAGPAPARKRVLLIGAGAAGVLAAREIARRGDGDLDVRGFLDDDDQKHGSVVNGVKVLGGVDDLPRVAQEQGVDHVVITIARATRPEFRRILDICAAASLKARVIPGLLEILQGDVSVNRIREVEIEDLLGRDPVRLDESELRAFVGGSAVLVTGAGGSIGAELARQVARFGPTKLVLLDRSEPALFAIDRELRGARPDLNVVAVVADVGDARRVDAVFAAHRPDVVFHAAAHKHVPMMEANPGEAVKNNVFATRTVGEAASAHGARAFVLVSTDKAVNPTSVMGASKRVAELVVQELGRRSATRFVAVRFGNVLGSAGSVVPIFRDQIAKGGPVTVTHPDMVRFFMTIPEACQLVMQAGAMAQGGEIFVLDMGEPVKIVELARDMIRLSGLRPGEDVEIAFTGVRPGEKMYEELQTTHERVDGTRHPKIFVGRIAGASSEALHAALRELADLVDRAEGQGVRAVLARLLPEASLAAAAADDERTPLPTQPRGVA